MKCKKKTIALRFADTFAPKEGTIKAHQELIEKNGFVWYGKLGNAVSKKVADEILNNEKPMILLIHSGKLARYWAHIESVRYDVPPLEEIPLYYRKEAAKFKTWFKILRITEAPKDVLSSCIVTSSGRLLSEVSKSSMSPYFIINMGEE